LKVVRLAQSQKQTFSKLKAGYSPLRYSNSVVLLFNEDISTFS
jgi:hypothetical protein